MHAYDTLSVYAADQISSDKSVSVWSIQSNINIRLVDINIAIPRCLQNHGIFNFSDFKKVNVVG